MGPDLESGYSIGFIPLEETDFLFPNREQRASWLVWGSFSMLGFCLLWTCCTSYTRTSSVLNLGQRSLFWQWAMVQVGTHLSSDESQRISGYWVASNGSSVFPPSKEYQGRGIEGLWKPRDAECRGSLFRMWRDCHNPEHSSCNYLYQKERLEQGATQQEKGSWLELEGDKRGMWDKCNKCIIYKYDTG